MKKTLSVLLIVATVLLVLVSCNSEQKFTEDLVSVSITSSLGKSLSGSTDFDVNNVTTWKYTAKKVNGGLKTGETSVKVALVDNVRTNPLSQGIWDFELYGYKTVNSEEKLICSGKVSNVKITTNEHLVSIVVAPSQTEQGTIAIGDIKIADSNGITYSGDEYTLAVEVYEGKSVAGTKVTLTDNKATVNSGSYYVLVNFTGKTVGDVHQGAVVVNVYDNLTTTVSGTIQEVAQSADMNKKAEKITASEEATVAVRADGKNNEEVKFEVASTPTGVGKTTTTTGGTTTTEEKKTSVSFPAGALQVAESSSASSTQAVSLEITSAPIETASASADYAITGSDGAVVAGFDFNLTGVESTSFSEAVTIETYIATGLGTKDDLAIAYVGTDTGSKVPSIESYDSTTGKIVFNVYHFSKYAVVSKSFVATDSNGKLYATFDAAIEASKNVLLLKDITLTDKKTINKDLVIDLNGRTLTLNENVDLTIGNSDLDENITVTIKNGTIDGEGYLINDSYNALLNLEDVLNAKRKSVWSGSVIPDGSGLSENWFDDVPLDFYKYNAETDTEYRDTYKNWFKQQFFDTGKASYEERKLSAESTADDEVVLTVYNADLFASFDLINKYITLLSYDKTNWTRIKAWTILVDVDLDFNDKEWPPLTPSGGVIFDFNNHTISGLKINSTSAGSVGLFCEKNGGTIKNLVILNAEVNATSGNNVGILAGAIKAACEVSNVTVKNSTVEGAKYVGGIVGHAWGTISNCKADTVTAKAPEQVGGIVGYIEQGGVTGCVVSGSIIEATVESSDGNESAGGIAGKAYACNGKGNDVPVTGNSVSSTTIKVGSNSPTTNIGYTENGYCGYIVGGKYINGKSGTTTTSGLETVEYDGGSGITTVKDNSYL